MSAHFDRVAMNGIPQPTIELVGGEGPLANLDDDNHDKLLHYLTSRLKQGNQDRGTRLLRYAKIDKLISTWIKLSAQDSEREHSEDVTGRQQALPMNLPLLASHLEDMVSYFAEIYAPIGRDFYSVPAKSESDAAKTLMQKMNRDTRARKYYKELCATIRTLCKYNVGGMAVRWETGGNGAVAELSQPGNRIESIDMYNYLYDPTILDVSKINTDAEWSARISLKNRVWLIRSSMKGALQRVDRILKTTPGVGHNSDQRAPKEASFYKFAPNQVGLSIDGQDSRSSGTVQSQTVDWQSYGASLESDQKAQIEGFEVVEMFCWLNPNEFGLVKEGDPAPETVDDKGNGLALYRFVLVDATQICLAERIVGRGADPEIPHYLSFMTQDDMKEAQRSVMEMMKGFQRFASFLLNVYVAGARKNIWGMKAVDPQMFDTSNLEQGDVAGILKSKLPGKDVRAGFMNIDSSPNTGESMAMLGQLMELVRVFYPSQAQPAQIAGIDRAVKSQVAAVMQGSARRLHMSCRLIDTDMMNPLRMQCYRNIAAFDNEGLANGLDEEIVAKVLGSGLEQIYAERVIEALKEILFAIIQNPESAQNFDLPALMTYWSRLHNTATDLGDFVRQQPAAQAPIDPAASPGGLPE